MSLCNDIFNMLQKGKELRDILYSLKQAGNSEKKIKKAVIGAINMIYSERMSSLEERKHRIGEGEFVSELHNIIQQKNKFLADLEEELPD